MYVRERNEHSWNLKLELFFPLSRHSPLHHPHTESVSTRARRYSKGILTVCHLARFYEEGRTENSSLCPGFEYKYFSVYFPPNIECETQLMKSRLSLKFENIYILLLGHSFVHSKRSMKSCLYRANEHRLKVIRTFKCVI